MNKKDLNRNLKKLLRQVTNPQVKPKQLVISFIDQILFLDLDPESIQREIDELE